MAEAIKKVCRDSEYRQTLTQCGTNTLKDLIGNPPSKSTWICLKQFCHN